MNMNPSRAAVVRLFSASLVTAAFCYSGMSNAQSLYDDLGGQPAIECWIDTGLEVITGDDRINDFFAGELNAGQAEDLRTSLVNFACAATGGPCVYVGRDMSCAHGGLSIDHHSFSAFLEDLEEAAVQCRRGNSGYMGDPAYSQLNKVLLSLRAVVVQDDPGENPGACP
ncbi:group 1 truncated hemoglobin [Parahaliea maris]|uniref:Group 1 truncated hemoglobin n=1 Tax=Parahaliea maris TaxID=2716870 RepID=A0A5C9A0C5_9GAMM|nr:group 1 truncated hemoglobin [Parahaliea maris]TXS93047.1 group 1 truncated hemoglobin [Parahaliea maris]